MNNKSLKNKDNLDWLPFIFMNIFQRIFKRGFDDGDGISITTETDYKSLKILDKKSPLDIDELSLYLNKAIEKRAREISKIKFKILNKNGEEDTSEEAKKYLDLLRKPNDVFAGTEFWRLYQMYRDLMGEAFIKLDFKSELFKDAKGITEMHLLIPSGVSITRDNNDGSILNYKYNRGVKTQTYEPEEVIRAYSPSPKNQLKAVSLIVAGRGTLETEMQLRDYQNKVLSNGGRIEGVFKFKGKSLTKKQIQELKDNYEEQYAGVGKAGKPLFVGGDADYQRVALNPQELAFLESMNATLDDICILTEVPKAILSNLTDIKYSNAEESRKIFLQHTIKPLADDLVNNLNEFLIPDNMTLTYEDLMPEDQEEKRKNLITADTISAMTTNEKRERLNLEPVVGGDEILVPMNKVPLSSDGGNLDQNKFQHPLKDLNRRKIYKTMSVDKMDKREAIMTKILKSFFKQQGERVIKALGVDKGFKTKGLEENIFNMENEIKVSISSFTPALREFLEAEGQETVERVGYNYEFVLDGNAESWLNERVATFSEEINKTTYTELAKTIADSIEAEDTRVDLIKRIEGSFTNMSKTRAFTIARTEVHSATTYGSFNGYKQAQIPIKIWVSVMDSATRPSHQLLDGEERPIDIPFSNGLLYPGDPKGSASEIINCRCVI